MNYSLKQIGEITGSAFAGRNDHTIHIFLTDSRDLSSAEGSMFVAIRTDKNNGHQYIPALIEKGVRSFLVQKGEIDTGAYKDQDISFLVSHDPLAALQKLAAHHRAQFKIPVIGITGSNGKTMVKEWLYQLLRKDHVICRSPKSFNSQLGVPLSILNLNVSHTLAIFEAGISKPGEMKKLQEMIKPTIGILTSLGGAHDEGFASREEKLKEKLILFGQTEWNIINGVDAKEVSSDLRSRSTLLHPNERADVKFELKEKHLVLSGKYQFSSPIPFFDHASVQNIATCVQTLHQLHIKDADIISRVKELQSIALRLEIKSAVGNSLVINDYYNSDLDSLRIALNFLQQQNRRNRKVLVISDMEQSGILDPQLYKTISGLVSSSGIDLVCGVGKRISSYRSLFRADSLFFENTAQFIRNFSQFSFRFSEATILLKGAHSSGFDEISSLLQQKSHDTVFEIDLRKLASNINYYRMLIGKEVKMMCMVKAMGYGGGGSELARTLQHLGANYLAVAYADEGVELRQSHITLPVMVMSPESDSYDDIINYNLEPEIYSLKCLREFLAALDHLGVSGPYPIHLKLDTGMHRLGFEEKDVESLLGELRKNPQVKVQSVFSHLSASDDPRFDGFTRSQLSLFHKMCQRISSEIKYPFLKHICNSGGVTRFREAHLDMVRLGIGMHGVGVNEEEQKKLENVGTLRTKISQIKTVGAGDSVGYNRSGKVDREMRVATIPIGYADGFSRALGNGRFGVYINGHYCRTVGSVCMDMCMVDVTEAKCSEGDEAIVFGNIEQLKQMAAAMDTITYEVLTGVSGRVKRVYVWE